MTMIPIMMIKNNVSTPACMIQAGESASILSKKDGLSIYLTPAGGFVFEKDISSMKYRHELKYNINQGEDYLITSRLRKVLSHDKYAGSKGTYFVNSLYFDTPYDKALREKKEGVKNREKFRLRYYDDCHDFIRLEKKMKTNGLCSKNSAVLTRQQAEKIIRGEIDFLLESGVPLLMEFYSKIKGQQLQPKTIVRYEREALLYKPGNVRVTLDRNIALSFSLLRFLEAENCFIPGEPGITVLEIKYDEYLPDIVKMAVQGYARGCTAFSKYAVARRYE